MKRKKVRMIASILAAVLTVSMSGCTVSVSFENKNKKTAETTETAEKKEETEKTEKKEVTKKAKPTATPTPEPTATPVPQKVEQAVPQNQYSTYYVVNCKQSITLRPQPDVNSGEILQIPLGSAVSYIGTASNGFYEIIYNGNRGYSLASYLSSSSGSSSYSTCRVVNCNESITLRPQPDVDSGEICQIPLGSTVSYVGTASNGFYEIYYMGQRGYSLADYLVFE